MKVSFYSVILAASVQLTACSPEQQLHLWLRDEVNARPVPGATAAVLIPGREVFLDAAGQRGPSDQTPMKPSDRFIIGSATKMFTAQLILQLAGEGRLSLDEPIARWFPDLPRAATTSVRHLLRHQSGIPEFFTHPDITADPLAPRTPKELVQLATSMPYLNSEPGGDARYSNTNYVLLALIVEHERGMSWSAAIHHFISLPLGLTSVAVAGESGVADDLPRPLLSAPRYSNWPAPFSVDASLGYGAGGIVSNANDLLIFMKAVRDGALVADGFRPNGADTVGFEVGGFKGHYGNGLMEFVLPFTLGGLEIRGHQGGIDGFCSFPFYDVKTGAIVVVLANGTIGRDIDATNLALNMLNLAARNAK